MNLYALCGPIAIRGAEPGTVLEIKINEIHPGSWGWNSEYPMELVDLTFSVREDISLTMPRAKTVKAWITMGFHEDLNEATVIALEGMLNLMKEIFGFERKEALALASLVVDLRITQIVNGVRGVHAVLPHGSIR